MSGKVIAVNKAERRGVPKTNVGKGYLRDDWGLEGDAHGGDWDRQISIFPLEAIDLVPEAIKETFVEGSYSENITVEGIPLEDLPVGTTLRIGQGEVIILQIGKDHFEEKGRPYIVSREGRFGRVTKSGTVKAGDTVEVIGHE
jgi:MOSC domain-containing protein YiiM